MKGEVLSCLCTFLSPKSKFSLCKKITKQRDNNNLEQVKEKHGKVACRQKKPYCSVWLVNICRVVMGPVPSSGYCLNNPYLNTRREMKTLYHYDSHVGLRPNSTPRPLWERKATKNRWGLGHALLPSLLESFQALWHPSLQEMLHRSTERAFLKCQSGSLEKTGNADLLPQTRSPLYEPGG